MSIVRTINVTLSRFHLREEENYSETNYFILYSGQGLLTKKPAEVPGELLLSDPIFLDWFACPSAIHNPIHSGMVQWPCLSGGYGFAGEQPERRLKPGDRAEASTALLFLFCPVTSPKCEKLLLISNQLRLEIDLDHFKIGDFVLSQRRKSFIKAFITG